MCNTNNNTQPRQEASVPANNEHLDKTSTYHVDGKSFIVTPVFRQEGDETLGSVLLKLIQTEAPK